jgi:hypothetical protein
MMINKCLRGKVSCDYYDYYRQIPVYLAVEFAGGSSHCQGWPGKMIIEWARGEKRGVYDDLVEVVGVVIGQDKKVKKMGFG